MQTSKPVRIHLCLLHIKGIEICICCHGNHAGVLPASSKAIGDLGSIGFHKVWQSQRWKWNKRQNILVRLYLHCCWKLCVVVKRKASGNTLFSLVNYCNVGSASVILCFPWILNLPPPYKLLQSFDFYEYSVVQNHFSGCCMYVYAFCVWPIQQAEENSVSPCSQCSPEKPTKLKCNFWWVL